MNESKYKQNTRNSIKVGSEVVRLKLNKNKEE